mmetsp:Transcript_13001/g.18404  ORF Transcript_13001/g.18404 Transcript_13001/m.18404 type:complete len:240 (+) Transcript_13001:95-814(+)
MVSPYVSLLVLLSAPTLFASAFQVAPPSLISRSSTVSTVSNTPTVLFMEQEVNTDTWEEDSDPRSNVERFLEKKFPAFYNLLGKNDNIWKTLEDSKEGYTLFAPSAKAFEDLGEKKLSQLEDPRNLETAQKIGLYHVVPTEAVTNQRLRTEDWTVPKPKDGPRPITVSGIQTLGGEVPVGRSKSGGFLGFGAKEDGDAVVGPNARISQSYIIGDNIVHEVDSLISPELLWRYCDQLRIL